MDEELKMGDPIAFDVPGSKTSPYGYGVVTRNDKLFGVLVTPDKPLAPGVRMVNIRKIVEGKKA